MHEFRVTKYDPSLRDETGAFQGVDWVMFSQIGEDFSGEVLTRERYEAVEQAYIDALERFLDEASVESFYAVGVENHRSTGAAPREGERLDRHSIAAVVRAMLREEYWCRLESAEAYVHIGWDYYMYVGVPRDCPGAIAFAQDHGLFVENFVSPYGPHIETINLKLPLRMGSVNCYLVGFGASFFLIDSGMPSSRKALLREIDSLGYQPGDLKLIVITHGDFDHTGNAATFRESFGAKIAMHRDDIGMAEQGDMFFNRKPRNAILRKLAPALIGFSKAQRFTPDVLLEDGDDLSPYGLAARVLSIPGHSKGSIGILTAAGELFCGDLLANVDKPSLGGIIDDMPVAQASLQRLRGLDVGMVYPGHGKPFPFFILQEGE
jgi:hydroxyacylglutathione hydrolase